MVTVFFQYRNSTAEKVATFEDEKTYMACLPALKQVAEDEGFTHVFESIN